MPTYVNPSTMMGGQLSPQSALHGALAGVQGAYATKMGDQQIRAEDLDFMANMHKYQQSVLDDPVAEAGRTEKIATSGYNTNHITSGRALDEFNTTLAGKKLNNEGKGLENEDKSIQLKGEFLNRIAQEVDNFNQRDPATMADWNKRVEEGAKLGVNLPSWPDDNTKKLIKVRAAAFVNSPKHQNAVDLAKQTALFQTNAHADPRLVTSVDGAIKLENARGVNAFDRVKETAEASRENARLKADANQRFGELKKVLAPALIEKIKRESAAGGLTEATIQQAMGYANLQAEDELQNTDYPMIKMAGMNNPEKAAQALAMKKAKVSEILDSMGINGASQAAAGKTVNSPSNPGAKPAGGPISSQAEYNALPKGTAYTWVYPDGKTKSGTKN